MAVLRRNLVWEIRIGGDDTAWFCAPGLVG